MNESIAHNYHDCVILLLNNGADPSVLDHRGENALHLCARRSDPSTLEILKSANWNNVNTLAENDAGLSARRLIETRLDLTTDLLSLFEDLVLKIEDMVDSVEFFNTVETVPQYSKRQT